MADKDFKVKNGIDVAGNANIDGNLNAAKYQDSAPSSPVNGQIWIDSDATAGVLNQNDYLLKADATTIYETQADAASTYAPLADPTFTGTVTTPIIRVTATDDASLSSTGHGLQVGLTNGTNIIVDGNEIMARNNGAANSILLNNDGGNVSVGTGGITTSGNIRADSGGADGGLVMRTWTGGSSWTSLATNGMTGSEYILLSQGAGTLIGAGGGDIEIRPGTNSVTNQLKVSSTGAHTLGGNLILSGDFTSTGLNATDATIEYIAAGDSASLSSNVGYNYSDAGTGNYSTYTTLNNASYIGIAHRVNKGRASDTTSDFITYYSNGNATLDLDFHVRGDGRIASDVATITSPADYAEYFEWVDGNPNAEDRVGIPVVLVRNKIVEATENSEDIIGIVSGRPGFIGDTAWSHWNEKYLIDDFGRRIIEDYEVYQWTEIDDKGETKEISYAFDDFIMQEIEVPENHTVVIQQRDKVNPNFDPEFEYVPREDRQEWDAIGLVGKVRMIKGKPVNPRWRKLQDITDTVEEWFIR
jgi:hypothetical protein